MDDFPLLHAFRPSQFLCAFFLRHNGRADRRKPRKSIFVLRTFSAGFDVRDRGDLEPLICIVRPFEGGEIWVDVVEE